MEWLAWLCAALVAALVWLTLSMLVGSGAEAMADEAKQLRNRLQEGDPALQRLRPLAARARLDDWSVTVQCALALDGAEDDLL